MLTTIMKWISICALLLAVTFWSYAAIATVFNLNLMFMAGNFALVALVATAAAFVLSLIVLNTQPLLSIPSITGRSPGSVSL